MKPRTMALNATTDAAVHSEPVASTGRGRSPFLTTKEAATYLRMSPRSIERLRVEGTGPEYKKCGTGKKAGVRYTIADLDAWLGGARRSTSEWDGG